MRITFNRIIFKNHTKKIRKDIDSRRTCNNKNFGVEFPFDLADSKTEPTKFTDNSEYAYI